jgi:hypothetical protein
MDGIQPTTGDPPVTTEAGDRRHGQDGLAAWGRDGDTVSDTPRDPRNPTPLVRRGRGSVAT